MMNTTCVRKKKVLVLAPFFHHESTANRPRIATEALSEFGCVDIVTTRFDHQTKKTKKTYQFEDQRTIYYLPTLPYRHNVSLTRFLSHFAFSLRAWFFFMKRRRRYDIVYATLPLNLLAFLVFSFSPDKLKIVDVVDIWPDVLPFPIEFKKMFQLFFIIWKRSFALAVGKCDLLLSVSDSFLIESIRYFKRDPFFAHRIYIGSQRIAQSRVFPDDERMTIAYIGNIGRLYDFQTLLDVLATSPGKQKLVLIGDGDRREWLLKELDRLGIDYIYHGTVYDEARLSEILSACDIGFNGYHNTTAAFSYKANTYFAAGLPVLNSMSGDLETLVAKNSLGFNYSSGDVGSLRKAINGSSKAALKECSMNVRRFFDAELDLMKVRDKLKEILKMSLGNAG